MLKLYVVSLCNNGIGNRPGNSVTYNSASLSGNLQLSVLECIYIRAK